MRSAFMGGRRTPYPGYESQLHVSELSFGHTKTAGPLQPRLKGKVYIFSCRCESNKPGSTGSTS